MDENFEIKASIVLLGALFPKWYARFKGEEISSISNNSATIGAFGLGILTLHPYLPWYLTPIATTTGIYMGICAGKFIETMLYNNAEDCSVTIAGDSSVSIKLCYTKSHF